MKNNVSSDPAASAGTLNGNRSWRRNAISAADRMVIKRDGTAVPFFYTRITRALALAFFEVMTGGRDNPYRDKKEGAEANEAILVGYGLDFETYGKVAELTAKVAKLLEKFYANGKHPTVEQVQDAVESVLLMEGFTDVARGYIAYRQNQADHRLQQYGESGLGDYIAIAKYARYRPEFRRRETFAEGVNRVKDMHLTRFAEKLLSETPAALPADIVALADGHVNLLKDMLAGKTLDEIVREAFNFVHQKRVLPSMRSMQFGGQAILSNHARLYNCSSSAADRVSFFREFFFLLLTGCGAGYSVQKHHVGLLPELPARKEDNDLDVVHHDVQDTIEGWADALDALINSYVWDAKTSVRPGEGSLCGKKVEFSYRLIRARGAILKTSGGRAPGHLPLKFALERVEAILAGAVGRKLRPIEVYDICCHVAKAVLSGGIRRSATICLFSHDDDEMLAAKTGNWFSTNSQRTASNNSAVVPRSLKDDTVFKKIFTAQRTFGEPGFYFADHLEDLTNPCCEISMRPIVDWDLSESEKQILYAGGRTELAGTTRLSGWSMCNLTTINAAACKSEEDFLRACIVGATLGTLQASYTDMPYLGPVTKLIVERDALLGVSICGFMDNPELFFNAVRLNRGARLVQAANRLVANLIGIRPAARTTCVKPEGTASLLLGAASGIHPHHSRYYFRRVQANRKDPIYQHFHAANPQMCERSIYKPEVDDVITFPVQAPKGAILRDEIGAVEFLQYIQMVQTSWVFSGTNEANRSPGLFHNVSNTVTVKDDEWDPVREFLWQNRKHFTGVSMLAYSGDKAYAQAPREEVSTPDDIARWNRLMPKPVDFTALKEQSDVTTLKSEAACAGGACEIVSV